MSNNNLYVLYKKKRVLTHSQKISCIYKKNCVLRHSELYSIQEKAVPEITLDPFSKNIIYV